MCQVKLNGLHCISKWFWFVFENRMGSFFWRCWFFGEDYRETIWNFWFSEYERKPCQNYRILASIPMLRYETMWSVYRGFWTALIVLAITASLVGVFLLVCGVPFVNARFYKVGGGFLMAAGCLFTLLIFMFVVWKEFAADLRKYILLERSERCPDDTPLTIYYGWSFMFATAGIPLVLLSGLLFYLVGHSILKELE
uniref:Uncharacterized protein n=1 Tax=Pseudonaja textilis TaxID=8673 RepID=A0A670YD50_PSETE